MAAPAARLMGGATRPARVSPGATLAAVLIAIAAAACGSRHAPPALAAGSLRGWNVVLVTLDATDARRLGTYGGNPIAMPFVDSLARGGVVFEHAYCTAGETGPSHATILSGTRSTEHGVIHNGLRLSDTAPWMPEVLQKAGYATFASTIAFFMDRDWGFARGFDGFAGPAPTGTGFPPFSATNADSWGLFAPLAARLESAVAEGKPFFAWIHLKGGHAPLTPVPAHALRRHSATLPADAMDPELAEYVPVWERREEWLLTPDNSARLRDLYAYYDANLTEADETVRRIVEYFRGRSAGRQTLFVITADHGESFDHGLVQEHGTSPWESTLRIPLIFYSDAPRFPSARVTDRLASTEDLALSLLRLLGVDPPSGMARDSYDLFGREARDTVDAGSSAGTLYGTYVAKIAAHAPDAGTGQPGDVPAARELENGSNFYWAVIRRQPDGTRLKLVYFARRRNNLLGAHFVHLYDLSRDPDEAHDLIRSSPRNRSIASIILRDARERNPLFGRRLDDLWRPGQTPDTPEALRRGLSHDALERLRSLGYLR